MKDPLPLLVLTQLHVYRNINHYCISEIVITYQLLLELCDGQGNIRVGSRWGETQETELAENGSIVIQRLGDLDGRRAMYKYMV